jgi:hypothetical protein
MPAEDRFRVFVTRIFILILGGIAIVWGGAVFPTFWRHSTIEQVAKRIINGHPYKRDVLLAILPSVERIEAEGYCRPSALVAAAIIRLRIAEEAVASGERQLMEEQFKSLPDSIRRSLVCSPASPFLWTVLYWIDVTQNGLRPDQMKLLRLSYRVGPNEGWIGIKRNRLAFNVFELLPPDVTEYATNEFLGLLNSAFYRQAVEIFTGPAWRVRDQILPRLNEVQLGNREIFARLVYTAGFDVEVPGIVQREPRPWRR